LGRKEGGVRKGRRAFLVCGPSWSDLEGIYAAISASKARYAAYRDANEVEFDLGFADLRVKRAPEFDPLAEEMEEGEGWALAYAKISLKEKTS
jgi:hypothetical protein